MSRHPRGHRSAFTVAAVASLLTAGLALSGCSAGTVTQTDTQVSGAPGGTGQTGDMIARAMTLEAPPSGAVARGDQVALEGTLINQSPQDDQLVGVTTPYAATVGFEGQPQIPAGNAVRLAGQNDGPVGPPVPGVRPTATVRLVLRNVTQTMRPGPTYSVTLTFKNQGSMTVPVTMLQNPGPSAG